MAKANGSKMVGQEWTKDDACLIEFDGTNPHRSESAAWTKYEAVKTAGTVGKAKELGAYAYDLAE
eukprot:3708940-Karenia_brevis.AAC.1